MARKRGQEDRPAIRRARYDRLTLIEITEDELDQLERGSPESIHLNFAILFLGVFVSFLVALLTTRIDSIRVYILFVGVALVSAVSGAVLFALWVQGRRTIADLIARIRRRLPTEEGIQVLPTNLAIPIEHEAPAPSETDEPGSQALPD